MTTQQIRMTIPAHTRFAATARVTATSIAAELDFSVDELEELRMGANELIGILIDAAQDHQLDDVELVFDVDEMSLTMTGAIAAADAALDFDVLARQILQTVVDDFDVDAATMSIRKTRSQP